MAIPNWNNVYEQDNRTEMSSDLCGAKSECRGSGGV